MRILRAVADEFPRDVDAAVEFILSDVIPIVSTEPEETSSHVHAPPALVLDAHHPPTGKLRYYSTYVFLSKRKINFSLATRHAAADGSLRAEETS